MTTAICRGTTATICRCKVKIVESAINREIVSLAVLNLMSIAGLIYFLKGVCKR
jgi:hypothetical protein